jgi:hypothetical protein
MSLNGLLDHILRPCFKYHIKTVIECIFDDQSTRLYSNGHNRLSGRSLRILIRYQKENKPLSFQQGQKQRRSTQRGRSNIDLLLRGTHLNSILIGNTSGRYYQNLHVLLYHHLHLFQHPSHWNLLKII